MKIIKEGKIPEEKTPRCGIFYRGKCSKCGCEFEEYEDEFYKKTEEHSECDITLYCENYTRETNVYVRCPTCKKEIKIRNVDTQYGIKKALDKEVHWYL